MKKFRLIFRPIATVFLVLLVILCVYTFLMTDVLKKSYVNVFGYTYFVVASGSMSGTIEVNDVIFVKITKDVKLDDIVTYEDKDGALVTHRLVNINGEKYILKGDINNTTDDPVDKSQIIGKVSFILSPSFLLKSIAVFLIIFIFLALVNFDKIIKKYIIKSDSNSVPLDSKIFVNPKRRDEGPSTGLTVTINLLEFESLKKLNEQEELVEEDTLPADDGVFAFNPSSSKKKHKVEKETIELVLSILKCKNNDLISARMNKKWVGRFQYVYRLSLLALYNNEEDFQDELSHPSFREIYDYDLEKSGLSETIRNRIYDLPIYLFLRLLTYTILFNDDEMFDGIYKILKYKYSVDQEGVFKTVHRSEAGEVRSLIAFMKTIAEQFDKNHTFELDKIDRLVRIKNY